MLLLYYNNVLAKISLQRMIDFIAHTQAIIVMPMEYYIWLKCNILNAGKNNFLCIFTHGIPLMKIVLF